MAYAQKTLNAAATTGYVISLGQKVGKVTVQTVGRAAFKVAYSSAPATPTNAYFPASGATTDTIELAAGGDDELTSEVRAVVGESLQSMDGCTVIDRGRVINPLLDVRNLVTVTHR